MWYKHVNTEIHTHTHTRWLLTGERCPWVDAAMESRWTAGTVPHEAGGCISRNSVVEIWYSIINIDEVGIAVKWLCGVLNERVIVRTTPWNLHVHPTLYITPVSRPLKVTSCSWSQFCSWVILGHVSWFDTKQVYSPSVLLWMKMNCAPAPLYL